MDKPKSDDWLTEAQLRKVFPRATTDRKDRTSLAGSVPKVFVKTEGDGRPCLVFYCIDGTFHVFTEIGAKQAARDCGVPDADARKMNTQECWQRLWREQK